MIEVKNLTKKYGDHTAVDNLTFHLEKGNIYGFLGPNGAGKSTTMNMITGYIAATSGEIKIDGHDIMTEAWEAKRHIGYLPEIPPLYLEMTVEEYLETVADLKQIPKAEQKSAVEGVMKRVDIEPMKERLIKNLSKGYRQRTGIAQALLGNPDIIILDEPTVGLDPRQIIEIRALIKELGKEHTVILSSHVLSEVDAVCDHILIINQGRLIASQPTAELEKMFQGKNNLTICADGEAQQIKELLEKAGRASLLNIKEEDGICTALLSVDEDTYDFRRKLFWLFCEAQLAILEMKGDSRTLEDVFLELTANAPKETVSEDIPDEEVK